MTPPRYHQGDTVTRANKPSPQVCERTTAYRHQQHGGGGGAKALQKRGPSQWVKLFRGAGDCCYRYSRLDQVFCAKPHLCLLLLQGLPQHSLPTSRPQRVLPKLPQQSPSTGQARHLLRHPQQMRTLPRSGFPASQSTRTGDWKQNLTLQPLTGITLLLSHLHLLGGWQQSSNHYYHTPCRLPGA